MYYILVLSAFSVSRKLSEVVLGMCCFICAIPRTPFSGLQTVTGWPPSRAMLIDACCPGGGQSAPTSESLQ